MLKDLVETVESEGGGFSFAEVYWFPWNVSRNEVYET